MAIFGLAAALTLPGIVASAQQPGQGQPGQRQGRGQGQGRFGMRQATLINVPVDALASALKLTDAQKKKIKEIQDKYAEEARSLRPQPGSPPDPSNREKMRDLNQKANKEIEDTLTAEQKPKVQDVLRTLGGMRMVGIPMEALGELKLTDDQKKKLAEIVKASQDQVQQLTPEERREKGRELMREARDKGMAVLTDEQKKILEKYAQQNRRQRPGGNPPPAP